MPLNSGARAAPGGGWHAFGRINALQIGAMRADQRAASLNVAAAMLGVVALVGLYPGQPLRAGGGVADGVRLGYAVSLGLAVFGLLCVAVAGIWGAITVNRRILLVQTVPAVAALALGWFA